MEGYREAKDGKKRSGNRKGGRKVCRKEEVDEGREGKRENGEQRDKEGQECNDVKGEGRD